MRMATGMPLKILVKFEPEELQDYKDEFKV
jgi:hypothetical protein